MHNLPPDTLSLRSRVRNAAAVLFFGYGWALVLARALRGPGVADKTLDEPARPRGGQAPEMSRTGGLDRSSGPVVGHPFCQIDGPGFPAEVPGGLPWLLTGQRFAVMYQSNCMSLATRFQMRGNPTLRPHHKGCTLSQAKSDGQTRKRLASASRVLGVIPRLPWRISLIAVMDSPVCSASWA